MTSFTEQILVIANEGKRQKGIQEMGHQFCPLYDPKLEGLMPKSDIILLQLHLKGKKDQLFNSCESIIAEIEECIEKGTIDNPHQKVGLIMTWENQHVLPTPNEKIKILLEILTPFVMPSDSEMWFKGIIYAKINTRTWEYVCRQYEKKMTELEEIRNKKKLTQKITELAHSLKSIFI